jgi:hypothetical protein
VGRVECLRSVCTPPVTRVSGRKAEHLAQATQASIPAASTTFINQNK